MNNTWSWVKKNWFVLLLIAVILGLLGVRPGYPMMSPYESKATRVAPISVGGSMMDYGTTDAAGVDYEPDFVSESVNIASERIVVQDTTMSMLVADVSVSVKGIEKIAADANGFMVRKIVAKPEGAANGEIVIRVPAEKRESILDSIRAIGIKVTQEDVYGNDVTDRYEDVDARIQGLNNAKSKMEKILDQATNPQDLMNIQNQIINLQQQIDSLKGRQNYLSQTAKLTKISVYLSTDELSLPYSPEKSWRPSVVLKLAVRSMIETTRSIANLVIWIVVYLPVVLIVIGIAWLARYLFLKIKK